MGRYLIKDADGRLWARAITRKNAVRLLSEITNKMTDKQFHIEEEKI